MCGRRRDRPSYFFAVFFTAGTGASSWGVTGFWLADELGLPVFRGALAISLLLYVLLGFLWLPVLWLHKRMGELAADSAAVGASLPPAFRGLYRLWSGLGWAALGTLLAIFWQMVARL